MTTLIDKNDLQRPLTSSATTSIQKSPSGASNVHDKKSSEPHEDIEQKASHEKKEQNSSPMPDKDGILWVDWDGPDDPENPKQWTYKKKWAATLVVSSFTFISPVCSSMVAPATLEIAKDLGLTSSALTAMVTSIFLLGYVIGPLALAPLSEIYGRSRVLQLANLFFLAWNLGCGFAQTKSQILAFRFLAGLGGSAPLAVGGGVLGDMWLPEQRGKAISIYSLAPLLGPVIGPVCGGWIAERSTWRWVFWSTSMFCVVVQISGIFFLRETFAPVLLDRKVNRLKKAMDPEKANNYTAIKSVYESKIDRSWGFLFTRSMFRPFIMFFQEPIMQLFGVYMAFLYGLLYVYLTTIPRIFAEVYHETPGIAGLHYMALGLGLSAASQFNSRAMDRIYVYFKNKNNGVGEPEFRLPSMLPGSIMLPIGLFISGWSAQNGVHWIAVDIGMAMVGAGMILSWQAMQTYLVDTFTLYAASALAATSTFRSIAGFGFPLFAPAMYRTLGYGKGDSLLACLAIALGCPAPFLFWKYGKRIRARSSFTQKPVAHEAEAKESESNIKVENTEKIVGEKEA